MEDNNTNSCLMLAAGLYTPVELSSIFDSTDLKDAGLELDSHITLLYAQSKIIPRSEILGDIEAILGPTGYGDFMGILKGEGDQGRVLDMFDLGSFENDSDYVVLKLKNSHPIYNDLALINKGLRRKYDVKADWEYTPHMTLAELNSGTAGKYLESPKLKLILEHSMVSFEDLLVSYGPSNVVADRKQYFLTTFWNIPRYFRLAALRKGTVPEE